MNKTFVSKIFLVVVALFFNYPCFAQTAKEYFDHGIAEYKNGEYAQAVDDFTRVIELEPKNADAYAYRGLLYGARGDISAVKIDLGKAIELEPSKAAMYTALVQSHMLQNLTGVTTTTMTAKEQDDFLKKSEQINKTNLDLNLVTKVFYGTSEVVKELLDKGADANAHYSNGTTALMCAASSGKIEIVKLLLGRGADVNMKNKEGETALMSAAARKGNADVINLLLDRGADINAKNNSSQTALMSAAWYAGLETENVKILLSRGADPNAKDNNGDTMQDTDRPFPKGSYVPGELVLMFGKVTPYEIEIFLQRYGLKKIDGGIKFSMIRVSCHEGEEFHIIRKIKRDNPPYLLSVSVNLILQIEEK